VEPVDNRLVLYDWKTCPIFLKLHAHNSSNCLHQHKYSINTVQHTALSTPQCHQTSRLLQCLLTWRRLQHSMLP